MLLLAACTAPEDGDPLDNVPVGVRWAYRYNASRTPGGIRERAVGVTGLRRWVDSSTMVGFSPCVGSGRYITFRVTDTQAVRRHLEPYAAPASAHGRISAYYIAPWHVYMQGSLVWLADSISDSRLLMVTQRDAHTTGSLRDIPGFTEAPPGAPAMLYIGGHRGYHPHGLTAEQYWLGYGSIDSLEGRARSYLGRQVPSAVIGTLSLTDYIK